jgi:hypothetical protein
MLKHINKVSSTKDTLIKKNNNICFYPVFNLAHTCQNIQYVECGQYTEEEEEEEEEIVSKIESMRTKP